MNKIVSRQYRQSPAVFVAFSVAAAVTAAAASAFSLVFGLPVWAMFVGWVAFFTRGMTARDGAVNLVCVWLGVVIGIAAATAIGLLSPALGMFAVPTAVFAVAMVVVSLRVVRSINNLLCYFLGLIAFFAARMEPTLDSLVYLGSASALGSTAGWLSMKLQERLPKPV